MAVQITDDGSTIKVVKNGQTFNFDKNTISLAIDAATNEMVIRDASERKVFFFFSDVTVPVTANLEALRSSIEALKDTAGGGLATAIKQDNQITELQAIKKELKRNATITLTNIASSITSVTLAASDIDRKELIIVNDGNKNLFIKFGATASATSYTIKLAKNETAIIDTYTGIVDGIWDVADGSARITISKE